MSRAVSSVVLRYLEDDWVWATGGKKQTLNGSGFKRWYGRGATDFRTVTVSVRLRDEKRTTTVERRR